MMIKKKSNFPLVDCRTTTHSETTCSFELLSLLFFMVVSVAVSVCPPGRLALSRGGRRRSSRSFSAPLPDRGRPQAPVTFRCNVGEKRAVLEVTYLPRRRAGEPRESERTSKRATTDYPPGPRTTDRTTLTSPHPYSGPLPLRPQCLMRLIQ